MNAGGCGASAAVAGYSEVSGLELRVRRLFLRCRVHSSYLCDGLYQLRRKRCGGFWCTQFRGKCSHALCLYSARSAPLYRGDDTLCARCAYLSARGVFLGCMREH